MIYKVWEKTCLFHNFIPYFQMEALRINDTKSLFSSYLTKEAEIKYLNGQKDNELNLDPKEVMGIIMQQCFEPHPNYSELEPSGIKSIFKLKDLVRNK